MTVSLPDKNHGPLRQKMLDAHRGADVTREELLALAKRHGQTPEIFDADFAEMGRRLELDAAYWASPEGLAITDARQKLAEATQAIDAALARYASDAEMADLKRFQSNAAKAVNDLTNANSEQFQAFAKAMKATAFPDGDYMVPDNLLIH